MSIIRVVHLSIALLLISALGGFYALRNLDTGQPADESRTVFIQKTDGGYQLIRNGQPFVIQGAGGDSHFKELADIGGNTIRLFDTTDLKQKLDEAHQHNLAVIVDFYIPSYLKSYYFYDDEAANDSLKRSIRDVVTEHKDHPALLIWNLGNEINYPVVLRKNDFIRTFNELIAIIHEVDPNHPVSTSIIGVGRKAASSIYIHSPELDLVSFNTFGNTKYVNSNLAQLEFIFGPKPYYFSEMGPDGPWESVSTSWGAPLEATTSKKAELYRTRTDIIKDGGHQAGLGTLIFYWGSKLERTHTWFSLFKDGQKSELIPVIEALWNPSKNVPKLIGLDHMKMNHRVSYDHIIVSPGELSHAEIIFQKMDSDSVRIEWELYPEAWFGDRDDMIIDTYKPIDTFASFDKHKTTFHAPITEGPYRLFAYIYNQDGFFATTNTPFYVLRDK